MHEGTANRAAGAAPMARGVAHPAYDMTARVLHWITAVLVLTMLPLGVVIANRWGGEWKDWLYNLHRSIGTVVMLVILVRLGYRLTHQPLPLGDEIPLSQRRASRVVHWALYTLLVAQPFVGWAGSSAFPAPVIVFGLFNLPMIAPADRALSDQLLFVHRQIGLTIACLVTVHIAAAIYHHFVRKDGVLMRMITG
jgi:cytochrome b561